MFKAGIYKTISAVAFTAYLVTTSAVSTAGTIYSDVYVFGDSLSDTGNVRDSLGFLGGVLRNTIGYGGNDRFSNGDVWHEYLSADLGLPDSRNSLDGGNNFAYGGALASGGDGITGAIALGMDAQINQYIGRQNGNPSDADALFITWVGGNDVRGYVGQSDPLAELEKTLDTMIVSLGQLLNSGVSTLMVPNLPDLGAIPEFASSANSAQATELTIAWNTGLDSRLRNLNELFDVELYYFDVYSIFNDLLNSPGDFGFTDTTSQCRSISSGFFSRERACANAGQTVFWDFIHPTTAAHDLLAVFAFDQLDNNQFLVPTPGTIIIFMGSLLLIVAQRKKGIRS